MIRTKAAFAACFILFFFQSSNLFPQNDVWRNVAGSAYLEQSGYDMLRRICDEAGGRLAGSDASRKTREILTKELKSHGLAPMFEKFDMPCWERGNDVVETVLPFHRKLRTITLGYVNPCSPFEAELGFAKYGLEENYEGADFKDKIVLITEENPPEKQKLLRYEMIDIAAKHGARAVLMIMEKTGTLNMAGVSNFQGNPAPIPAFSITYEEGNWLKRLLERNIPVRMKIEVKSRCVPGSGTNIVCTLPGKSPKKIVIGAHIDSWDIGQGAVDNGYGTAILLDVARLAAKYSPNNDYTLEFVWYDGEELGLWGSRYHADTHKDEIAAMINMDMTGTPTGINTMGFESFRNFFKGIIDTLNGFDLKEGVVCNPWVNSDHTPYMLHGIPSFVMQAKLDKDMYWYYHDTGDSFDKVDKRMLADAAAVVTIFAIELANMKDMPPHLTEQETIELHKKYKLDERLKRQKQWKFPEKE